MEKVIELKIILSCAIKRTHYYHFLLGIKAIQNPITFFDNLYMFFQRLKEKYPDQTSEEIAKKFVALSGDWNALETHLQAIKNN